MSFGDQHQDVVPKLTPERIDLLRTIAGVSGQSQVTSYTAENDTSDLTPERIELLRLIASTDRQTTPSRNVVLAANTDKLVTTKQSKTDREAHTDVDYHDHYSDGKNFPDSLNDLDWIYAKNADHYTIQLALTVNRPFLVQFSKQLPSGFSAIVFPEKVNKAGKTQYSLSTGSYPTRELAEAAMKWLPSKILQYGAYPRKFEEMQNASI